MKPTLAIKATPGEEVKAYVVINDVNNKVTDALKNVTPSKFSEAFSAAAEAIASEVSAFKDEKDVILMTNTVEPTAVTLVAGVTEADAKVGTVNLIKVDVQRVVSRAIVTIKTDFKDTIDVANANGVKGSIITIKDVKYGVGQSNKNFFILQNKDFLTPPSVYSYLPGVVDALMFDNSGLAAMSEVSKIADKANAKVVAALAAEKPGKFVLPVTHAAKNYVKGNTTYFEIQIAFTPDYVDGTGTYNAGDSVYLGKNDGKFYTTREKAEESGQKSVYYKGNKSAGGAIAKYIVWLNPDVVPGTGSTKKASQSPTVRNQVYHVHITGFKKIGVPNNPLNPGIPEDPTKPVGPDNPINPKYPADPNDPADPLNPIDPTHPLETEDTYLSVEITVLPYTVHSYEVDLGTDY
ncbi:MAG TPA: Mfa1 family fimbria major subunit [Bacteroides reticulotermitis]|nr:Mfa1 family fimbria major subunit [Bacteroides reticulotermitis]